MPVRKYPLGKLHQGAKLQHANLPYQDFERCIKERLQEEEYHQRTSKGLQSLSETQWELGIKIQKFQPNFNYPDQMWMLGQCDRNVSK